MKEANVLDLRRYSRAMPEELFALVGEEILPLRSLSVAGVCIGRPKAEPPEGDLEFAIAPMNHGFLDVSRAARARGHVVGRSETEMRIVFSTLDYDLAALIQRHQGTR